jgi:hypothetical protein
LDALDAVLSVLVEKETTQIHLLGAFGVAIAAWVTCKFQVGEMLALQATFSTTVGS